MIESNLSVLLAERKLKITKVSRDTGISRTTLTALCYDHTAGIKFDTLNTLCNYLAVRPEDFFNYSPYDFELVFYRDSTGLEEDMVAKQYNYYYWANLVIYKHGISWTIPIEINTYIRQPIPSLNALVHAKVDYKKNNPDASSDLEDALEVFAQMKNELSLQQKTSMIYKVVHASLETAAKDIAISKKCSTKDIFTDNTQVSFTADLVDNLIFGGTSKLYKDIKKY